MRVAVTGGIAEGKSTVLRMLEEAGYTVASSDAIARELFLRSDIQEKLADLSGLGQPVTPDALRERMFERPELRREVNALVHPEVLAELRSSEAQFVEVPLLIEACLQGEFDLIWVVTCGPREQLRRLVQRTGDQAVARSMIGAQLPSRVKCVFADEVIRTNQSIDTVHRFVTMKATSAFGKGSVDK